MVKRWPRLPLTAKQQYVSEALSSEGPVKLSTPFRLLLPRQLHKEVVAQAQSELPNECCGILAGTLGTDGIARITHRYALVNALASPTEYEWEAKCLFAAVRDMRKAGVEMLAIYHSHPTSAPIPSRKDRERYDEVRPLVGEVMHFIIGCTPTPPEVRAWWLTRDDHHEAEWDLTAG
jgi:proteasome lid subunit RPN8/RPN11